MRGAGGLLLLWLAAAAASTVLPPGYRISTRETWDVFGSPYIMQGDVYIDSPGHLNITNGAEVRVAADAQLVVNHMLTVSGFANNRVVFRGDATTPSNVGGKKKENKKEKKRRKNKSKSHSFFLPCSPSFFLSAFFLYLLDRHSGFGKASAFRPTPGAGIR